MSALRAGVIVLCGTLLIVSLIAALWTLTL